MERKKFLKVIDRGGVLLAIVATKDIYKHDLKLSELSDEELDELCQEIESISKKYGLHLLIDVFNNSRPGDFTLIATLIGSVKFFTFQFHDVNPKFIDTIIKYNIDIDASLMLKFKKLYDNLSNETKLMLEVEE